MFFIDCKSQDNGTISRVLMTILNITLSIWSIISIINIAIFKWIDYAAVLIPIYLLIVCCVGCSVNCFPNKKVMIVYIILMGLLIVAHFITFVVITHVTYENSNKNEANVEDPSKTKLFPINYFIASFVMISLEAIQVLLAVQVMKSLNGRNRMVHSTLQTKDDNKQTDEETPVKFNLSGYEKSDNKPAKY